MSLPNPGMSFTPFDTLPASDLNDIVENVEALADGTGLDDGSITNAKLATATGELGGAWSSWTPTLLGFSGTPTVSYAKYKQIGKTVHVIIGVSGTSNSGGKTFTPPVPAATWQDAAVLSFSASNDGSADYLGGV